MKKITAFLTAATMAFSMTACWKGDEASGATLNISLELSYISEQLNVNGGRRASGVLTTDKGLFLTYSDTSKDSRWHVLFFDASTNETTEMELHTDNKKDNSGIMFTYPDGRVGILYQQAARASRKNWKDEAHDAYIDVYNADLTYSETIPLSLETGGTYVYEFFAIEHEGALHYVYNYRPNGFVYSIPGDKPDEYFMEIMLLNEQMELVNSMHIPDNSGGQRIRMGASGAIYLSNPIDYSGKNYVYNRVNLNEMRLEALDLEIDKRFAGSDIVTGTNGYEFYSYGDYGICGITIDGNVGTSEQIMDFRNSDFLSGSWIHANALPDGRFIIQENNMQSQNLWLSRKRTEEELDVQVITMAGVGFNEQLEEVVTRFNRNHPEYRIMMFDYTQYVEVEKSDDLYYYGRIDPATAKAASDVFMQDLMNGIVPDIICTDNLPYVQLANKGIFLDMTELMKKDDRFQEENYVMPFFDSMKYKGQQQTIAFSFYINTIGGETAYVGDNIAMSPEEYLNMINNRPEGMHVLSGFQENYADDYLSWMQNGFLDTENLACSFDSPAFVKLLEIGSTLPKDGDWENYVDSGTLLIQRTMNLPIVYREMQVLDFAYEPMTLVGYPTTDPNGNGCIFSAPYTVGINAMSQYKDVVWDIFMELLSEETQRFLDVKQETYSFPVLRSALEEDMHASTVGMRSYGFTSVSPNSEEDTAFLMEYIEHATMFYYADPTIMNIISEEAAMYYAGDQTAQEAAKMIQSRASIYLSEQY